MLYHTRASVLSHWGVDIMQIEEQWFHEGVYGQQRRILLVEDDMMSPEEDGFMQGYEEEIVFEEGQMAEADT
jgi:hypothetical protein